MNAKKLFDGGELPEPQLEEPWDREGYDHVGCVTDDNRVRLGIDRTELDAETQQTILALEQAEDRMRLRATSAFMDGDEVTFEASSDFGQVPDDQAQQTVVEIVFEEDRALIAARSDPPTIDAFGFHLGLLPKHVE